MLGFPHSAAGGRRRVLGLLTAVRLLILNWRDPWHPKAGGAELVTLRITEGLTRRGWEVEWFSGAYAGAPAEETRDGIRFVRAGSQASVHLCAWRRYAKTRAFDVVVEEINTLPFYAHTYQSAPTLVLIFQLAQEVWHYEARPIGWIGAAAERFYLAPFRAATLATISESSLESLRAMGLRGPATIVPIAVDEPADAAVPPKTEPRDVVLLARVTRSKRPEHAIAAAAIMHAHGWRGTLRIVGGGAQAYVDRLRATAEAIAPGSVVFTGHVDEAERLRILRAASCIWMTSVREGWGLAITEAARHGTPAVVYRVPGLVDAVRDGDTGYVVPADPRELAAATLRLFESDFDGFAERALVASRSYNWDTTTDRFETAMRERIARG
jgi:glycosyltransferase involved in cell wall biosynthesis